MSMHLRQFATAALVVFAATLTVPDASADDKAAGDSPSTGSFKPNPMRPFEPEGKLSDLSPETRKLFMDLKKAAEASADVFAALSVEQLNFRPANGTHTPRWNAEHMAAVHESFFSRLYHSIDDRIKVINDFPKQMPDDYKAAHPTWDGEKEAGRIRRAEAFARRYAYLLKDTDMTADLEKGILPGFFKTPESLLKIVAGHYGEHTANVKKKFDAEGWPKSDATAKSSN